MKDATHSELIESISVLLNYLAISDEPTKADIIWGLGSKDVLVAKKAAEFFHSGLSSKIVFSGGNGHRWKELTQTEAELFKAVAIEENVPEQCIIIENRSIHTGENIAFSLKIFDEIKLKIKSALLITIPPFQRRAMITVATQCKFITCINNPISWGAVTGWDDEHLIHVARLCIGEVYRLQDYPGRGFIQWDPHQIPLNVLQATKNVEKMIQSNKWSKK